MKTVGMIGGMSWESTVTYYQVLNRMIQERLGGLHSAKCIVNSVEFHEIEECQSRGEWERSGTILAAAAKSLEAAGADCVLICTNTMHKVADAVERAVSIPLIHIAEATADELERGSVCRVGLLGTRYTMEQDFYKERLIRRGIEVLVPGADDRARMNGIIFDELCLGRINGESRDFVAGLVDSLQSAGAEGVILGCTEIGLLLKQGDVGCPLYDTTMIHAASAAAFALSD